MIYYFLINIFNSSGFSIIISGFSFSKAFFELYPPVTAIDFIFDFFAASMSQTSSHT